MNRKCTWLDGELDKLIKYKNTTNKGKVNWKENIGQSLICIDKDGIKHVVIIQSKIPKIAHIIITSEENELDIFVGSFINCQLNSLFNIITKDFKKSIGDVVGNFTIISIKRKEDKTGKLWKTYGVKCNLCGEKRDIREYDLLDNKCSCLMCSDGILFPEKFTMNLLAQLNIKFIRQNKFDWCIFNKFLSNEVSFGLYDFVLENTYITINKITYKTIIEMDGGFHNKDNLMSGQTKEELKYIDDIKDELAKENGYYVIRIDCDYPNLESRFDFIKNKFTNNIYIKTIIPSFDIINWSLVYDFTCSSLKVKCWELKNSNQELFTYDIANELGISSTTVKDYLTEGHKHGKCRYNTEEQNQMRVEKVTYINSRPIEVFKDGESKGVFFNSSDCSRISLEEFGIQFSPSHIRSVCRGDRKSHQGHIFKEISKEEYLERIR